MTTLLQKMKKARFFCYIIFFSNSSMYAQACSMEFVGYNHCGFRRCGNGIRRLRLLSDRAD